MKKKKRTTPTLRQLYDRAHSEHSRRSVVGMAARYIQSAWKNLDRAINAAEGSDEERSAMEDVKDAWFMAGNLMNFGKGNTMDLVADKLDGKREYRRKGGDYDEEIEAACDKVTFTRTGIEICPRFTDFKKAFVREWRKKGLPEHMMPGDFSLRRSLARLGSHVGRPRKRP